MPAKNPKPKSSRTVQALVDTSSEENAPLPQPSELAEQPFAHLIDDDDGPAVPEANAPAVDSVGDEANAPAVDSVGDEAQTSASTVTPAPQPPLIAVVNPIVTGSTILNVAASPVPCDLLSVNHAHESPSLPPASALTQSSSSADAPNLLPVAAASPAPPVSPSVMPALPALPSRGPTLIGHTSTIPPVPRFNQPPKGLRASVIPPAGNDDGTPVIRIWEGPKEIRDSDGEEDDFESNPFGIQRAPKEKPVVLHPAIVDH
jgi:hypothetical protein